MSEYKNCEECGQPYGYIHCRITIQLQGTHNVCLKCHSTVKARLMEQKKLSPVSPQIGKKQDAFVW